MIASININKQKNNSKHVSNINIKSPLTITAYTVYDKLLVTHKIQDLILKSSDFFVFINLTICGKYDIKVQNDTIPNKTFPNINPPNINNYKLQKHYNKYNYSMQYYF